MNTTRIVILGNTFDFNIFKALLSHENIEVVGAIIDIGTSLERAKIERNFLYENGITELMIEDIVKVNPDIAFIISYSRIIDIDLFGEVRFINLHGGLLPKGRGLCSNPWAVINNEKEIGYTLHLLDEGLDSGPIYTTFKITPNASEVFFDMRKRIHNQVINSIGNLLVKISTGNLLPTPQDGERFVYSTKLRKSDGVIQWSKDSSYIFNLWRVMGFPYGSGVFFNYDNVMYEVSKMSLNSSFYNYIGICGAVVLTIGDSILVKTADNVISIDEIIVDSVKIAPSSIFKIGYRLS